MVPADRTAGVRRHQPAPACSQRELRTPDRKELHPVPASDHLAALRTADPAALCRAAFDTPGRTRYRRCRHHGHLAFQHADQHRKYKESLRNSGAQEDNHRPAAESGAHVRDLHRGRMQPPGTFGGHVRGRKPGQQPLQPPIYIWGLGTGQDAHRTGHRPRGTPAPSRVAGAVCLDEQIPGAVPDRVQERRNPRFHPFLPDDRRTDHRRHPGTDREDGHAECVLQHLQPPTAGGQTADSHLGQAARGAERHRTAPADALQVGIVGTAQHARLRHEAQDHPRKGAEVRGADFGRRGGLPGGQHLGQRA